MSNVLFLKRVIQGPDNKSLYKDAIAHYKYFEYPGRIVLKYPHIRDHYSSYKDAYTGYLHVTNNVNMLAFDIILAILESGGLPTKNNIYTEFLSEQEMVI
jgi:hypothetical protein